jgi:hypothetical protein
VVNNNGMSANRLKSYCHVRTLKHHLLTIHIRAIATSFPFNAQIVQKNKEVEKLFPLQKKH